MSNTPTMAADDRAKALAALCSWFPDIGQRQRYVDATRPADDAARGRLERAELAGSEVRLLCPWCRHSVTVVRVARLPHVHTGSFEAGFVLAGDSPEALHGLSTGQLRSELLEPGPPAVLPVDMGHLGKRFKPEVPDPAVDGYEGRVRLCCFTVQRAGVERRRQPCPGKSAGVVLRQARLTALFLGAVEQGMPTVVLPRA